MSLEKKVLLINCRSPYLDDSKIYVPLANLYLKSYVEEHSSHQVFLGDDGYDLNCMETFEPYDIIGLSVMTPQRQEALNLLGMIKLFHPTKKVVIGGPHVKYYLSDLLNQGWDHIVNLDGERALLKILNGEASRIVSDVMTKQDILDQPRPDRSSYEAKKMIKNYHYRLGDRNATTMMVARGCPEKCTFCEDRMTAVKWSSIENIRAELDDINNLGYGGVYIFDDIFAIAMPKVRPICEELAKRDLSYRCNGQVRYFTKWGEDFALMLASTGCREIAFGFETGSQKILDNVMKGTSVKQNYLAVQYAKKFGLKVKGFMMIGLPGESMKTIEETETFIRESGMDDFQLAIYYPYKGTKIRDDIDAGMSDVNLSFLGEGLGAYGQKGGSTECVISVGELSSADLLRERDRIVKFYKPKSHEEKWKDKFFETYLKDREVEGHFEGEF